MEPQAFAFQAEVNQLLDLVIHSLYSHQEVFLRELVSNASDALDKLRVQALTDPDLLKDGAALEIRLRADKVAGTLTIEDTGVGMTQAELVKNLGTIAHSGTKAFLEAAKAAGKADGSNLIGQFGVGFYAAYLVADRVDVVSRAVGASEAFRWSSDAKTTFTVGPAERAERGTEVVLHLKADQKQFLEEWQLKELVRRYSDFVGYPIKLATTKKDADGHEQTSYDTINRASALWQRSKNEITSEQYDELYRHLAHDGEAPLARTHFTIEGNQVFTCLLFIPKKAPRFELEAERKGVRLFVKRVFIMDDCRELLPPWLRFVRGIVDSDDLPLNVSRELLQDSAIVRTIKKQVVKKVLDLVEDLAKNEPNAFLTFWKAWGVCLKEAAATDFEVRDRVTKLLRYKSTKSDETVNDGLVSLEEYVARMPLRQEAIYYVVGESEASLAAGPYVEALAKHGFEALLMTDPIDEWVAESLQRFQEKPLVSAMASSLKLPASDEDKKARESKATELSGLLGRMKEILGGQVADVVLSDRLSDSPACLVVADGQPTAFLEQILKAHGRGPADNKRILEINPTHPLMASLRALFERDPKHPRLEEWTQVLHDQAVLTEGGKVPDPNRFAKRVADLLSQAAQVAVSG